MFKKSYINYLTQILNESNYKIPGYKVKVIDEISYEPNTNENESTIIVVVKFGVSVKAVDDIETYIQPFTLEIYSEAFGANQAYKIFEKLFKEQSHKTINDTIAPFKGMITYTSPSIVKTFSTIEGLTRSSFVMSGQAIYSTNIVSGITFYLGVEDDLSEIILIGYSSIYQTVNDPVSFIGAEETTEVYQSSCTTINLSFYARKNSLYDYLEQLAFNKPGVSHTKTITFKQANSSEEEYIFEGFVSRIEKKYQPSSGMFVFDVNLSKKGVIT